MGKHKRILTPQEIKEKQRLEEQKRLVDQNEETKKLTPMQKRLVAEIIRDPGAPAVEQIRRAGYKVTANSKPHHVKKRLEGKLGLTLREFGIFEDDLAKVAFDCLRATNVKVVKVTQRDADGKVTKEDVKFIETPDYKTRLATFRELAKLGDYFPAKKTRHEGSVELHAFRGVDPDILRRRKEELEAKAGEQEIKSDYTVETVDA